MRFRDIYKKDADVVILNGFPINYDKQLFDNDTVSFIKKGEKLSKEEIQEVMISRHTPGVYEVLKEAKVGIAGLGGLGSNIALSLARIGVGNLTLVDFDVVEPSNLNRQAYYIEQLGCLKTEATLENIKRINPFINIDIINTFIDKKNAKEIFKDCEIVIEAFDNPICKAELINSILLDTDKIIVSGNGMAGVYPSNTIKTKKLNKRLYICGDGVSEAKEFSGLMSTRVLIASGHMANTTCRVLLKNIEVDGEL